MADNRIYLKCSICGGELYLGKSFYHGLSYKNYSPEDGSLEDKLNGFYIEHDHLLDGYRSSMLGTHFYIVHECFDDERLLAIKDLYDRD